MLSDLTALAGLFIAAFAAATVFPFQSEAVLVALMVVEEQPVWLLVAVASIGNTLGSAVNWMLGRGIDRLRHKRWFPVGERQLDRAAGWYHRWGKWSLLMSWAPFIGDPLTVAAGVLREPFWTFLALVAVAKTGRYVLLAVATLGVI